MTRGRAPFGAVVLVLVAGACAVVDTGEAERLPGPSRATFTDEAEPLLEKRCGDGACHGMDRPYALYAVGQRRVVAADVFSAEPLTRAEVDANYVATLGFLDAPTAVDTTLIRKALGLGGPGGHRGGVVFEAPSDPECRAVVRWIEGGSPTLASLEGGSPTLASLEGGSPTLASLGGESE